MSDRKVEVVNMTNATVTLVFPNGNFKRVLKGEGARTTVPFDVLYEGLSEPGMFTMLRQGIIQITKKEDRVDLGLEEEENIAVSMSSADMLKVLKENNPISVKATLEGLSDLQRKKFVQVAVENDIYSAGLAKFVKDYTGIDLLTAMKNHKMAQEDAAELKK